MRKTLTERVKTKNMAHDSCIMNAPEADMITLPSSEAASAVIGFE
jgi:hypothetical protein